jgi:hypothetical protein
MRLILTLALLVSGTTAFAQDIRPIECRFLAFGVKDDAAAIAVSDKGEEIACPLPTSNLSKRITCTAKDGKIPFLAAADRKPMATASIPSGVNSALVVFVRLDKAAANAAPSAGWRVFVIDDSAKSFPDGGAYVANFYSSDIRFVIGEHKGLLKAAGTHGYAMPKERDDFNMAPVIFEFLNGDKWRIANESSLRFLPGMRYLIFAYVDPVSGRPKINTYQDLAQPSKTAASP